MPRHVLTRHALTLSLVLGLSLSATPAAVAANESLRGEVQKALRSIPGKAKLGVRFETPEGKVLFASRSERALLPASNMKLVTTTTALYRLGTKFQHETRIVLAGRRQTGLFVKKTITLPR